MCINFIPKFRRISSNFFRNILRTIKKIFDKIYQKFSNISKIAKVSLKFSCIDFDFFNMVSKFVIFSLNLFKNISNFLIDIFKISPEFHY